MPPQQTMSPLHIAPSGTFCSPWQTGCTVEHDVVPVWQGLFGAEHVAPAAQLTQAPSASSRASAGESTPASGA
jgi:hypothetical protein